MLMFIKPFVELVERVYGRRYAPFTRRLVVLVVCENVNGGAIDRLNHSTCDKHHGRIAHAPQVLTDCCRLAHAARSTERNDATDPELKGRWTAPPAEKRRFFGVLE